MSNWIIALLFSLSISVWLYTKIMKNNGNNTRGSIIVVAVSAVVLFVLIYFLLGLAAGAISGK